MATKRTKMSVPRPANCAYGVNSDALVEAIVASHAATNKLMEVQFASVRDQFSVIHDAMKAVKSDVEAYRAVTDERHLSLVKKVWMGIGGVAALEAIIAWHPWR